MTIAAGTRLGPYEVLAPLGAGGMGEVYRARDTRLARDVAVKVLAGHLSANPEVRARFEREARTVSSLNHPHICTLFDVGRDGDTDFLVMELVEGETLARRLAKGALPSPEVLRIGIQIADALDRAHRAGVIHRDLKPGNVMLTRSGAKLMDFGLARATGLAPTTGSGVTAPTQSPTLAQPLTAEGTLVGTFQYMAPELLEGQAADARSDLWSFGAMLYEMATGRRAFEGKSQASLIAAILEHDPAPIATLAPLAPPGLDRVVRACLAKDPEQRLQTAHDLKLQLEWIAEGGSQAGVAAPVAAQHRSRERLAWGLAAAGVVIAGLAVMLGPRLRPSPGVAEPSRFTIVVPQGVTIFPDCATVSVSPDGRSVAFLAIDSAGVGQIWLRPLSSLRAAPLAGTMNGFASFWSPDGRTLGVFGEGKLKKFTVAGGPPEVIADAVDARGGTWSRNGDIVFAPTPEGPLFRVPAAGGEPVQVTWLDSTRHETGHRWPCFLPDGRHFTFAALPPNQGRYEIYVGELGSRRVRRILSATAAPVWAPPGYLVYVNNASLVAQRFDARGLRTRGDPISLGEASAPSVMDGAPRGLVSRNGTLVGFGSGFVNTQVRAYERNGRRLADLPLPPGRYENFRISPSATKVVLERRSAPSVVDLWLADMARPTLSRFTFGSTENTTGSWSPDGSRIAFNSKRSGPDEIYVKDVNGSGEERLLPGPPAMFKNVSCWGPDGIVYWQPAEKTGWDLWSIGADGKAPPVPLTQSASNELGGEVSPDGRWLAYISDESGHQEVYVRSMTSSARYQVSESGQNGPSIARWTRGGRELVFPAADGATLMAADFAAGPPAQFSKPRALFKLPQDYVYFDITPDGQRILATVPTGETVGLTVTLDWTAALGR